MEARAGSGGDRGVGPAGPDLEGVSSLWFYSCTGPGVISLWSALNSVYGLEAPLAWLCLCCSSLHSVDLPMSQPLCTLICPVLSASSSLRCCPSCCSLLPFFKIWKAPALATFSEILSSCKHVTVGNISLQKSRTCFFSVTLREALTDLAPVTLRALKLWGKRTKWFLKFCISWLVGLGSPRASFPPPSPLLVSYSVLGHSPDPWSIPSAEGPVGGGILLFPSLCMIAFPHIELRWALWDLQEWVGAVLVKPWVNDLVCAFAPC